MVDLVCTSEFAFLIIMLKVVIQSTLDLRKFPNSRKIGLILSCVLHKEGGMSFSISTNKPGGWMKFSYLVVRSIFIIFFIIVARFSVGRDINISLLNPILGAKSSVVYRNRKLLGKQNTCTKRKTKHQDKWLYCPRHRENHMRIDLGIYDLHKLAIWTLKVSW